LLKTDKTSNQKQDVASESHDESHSQTRVGSINIGVQENDNRGDSDDDRRQHIETNANPAIDYKNVSGNYDL